MCDNRFVCPVTDSDFNIWVLFYRYAGSGSFSMQQDCSSFATNGGYLWVCKTDLCNNLAIPTSVVNAGSVSNGANAASAMQLCYPGMNLTQCLGVF